MGSQMNKETGVKYQQNIFGPTQVGKNLIGSHKKDKKDCKKRNTSKKIMCTLPFAVLQKGTLGGNHKRARQQTFPLKMKETCWGKVPV